MQFYVHTNYASKRVTEGFCFRHSNNRANIYSLDDGETLLIGDVLAAAPGAWARPTWSGSPTTCLDQAALARVFANPNCISFQEIAPGGFTPRFGGVVLRPVGDRGCAAPSPDGGLTWDASASNGGHESRTSTRGSTGRSRSTSTFDVSYAA